MQIYCFWNRTPHHSASHRRGSTKRRSVDACSSRVEERTRIQPSKLLGARSILPTSHSSMLTFLFLSAAPNSIKCWIWLIFHSRARVHSAVNKVEKKKKKPFNLVLQKALQRHDWKFRAVVPLNERWQITGSSGGKVLQNPAAYTWIWEFWQLFLVPLELRVPADAQN